MTRNTATEKMTGEEDKTSFTDFRSSFLVEALIEDDEIGLSL